MRIVIDLQGYQSDASRSRGVGRYTKEMVKAVLKAPCQNRFEFFIVLNGVFDKNIESIRSEFRELLPPSNIKCWQQHFSDVSGSKGDVSNRKAAEFIREWFISQLKPDVIWSTNLQEGWTDSAVTSVKFFNKSAFYFSTLHDVTPLMFPDQFLNTDIKSWYEEKINAVKSSDVVFTVSEFSKKKIIELLGVSKEKVIVEPNSYNKKVFNSEKSQLSKHLKHLIKSEYILHAGGADAHKNLNKLIAAYSLLKSDIKKKYKIAFVGQQTQDFKEELISYGNTLGVDQESLVFLGYVNDKDLANLYKNASLFAFPSYAEGFGLPVLEAMACNCPVIAANETSIPEVMGSTLGLFDPHNEKDMSIKMSLALTNEEFINSLKDNARKQINHFSWDLSAKIITGEFERLVINRKKHASRNNQLDSNKSYQRLTSLLSNIEDLNMSAASQSIADSFIITRKKKLLYIDISSLVHFDHATGIQRVVRAIVSEFQKNDQILYDVKTVFSYAGHRFFYKVESLDGSYLIPDENDLNAHIIEPIDGDILLFLDLHPANVISKKHELQTYRKRGVRVCSVLYDLIPISLPQYFVSDLCHEFRKMLLVFSELDGIFCISKTVSQEFRKWIDLNRINASNMLKIGWFYLGSDIENSNASTGLPTGHKKMINIMKKNKTFLMVGTVEPRKRHDLVLDAFELLWDSGLDIVLIIVGREGWENKVFIDRLRNHSENGKHLFWLSGISDEYLDLIYFNATCLIAASDDEGFGLPLIEAAKYNMPIIASDINVFKEVAGDCAFYFYDRTGTGLSKSITNWIELYKSNKHPKSNQLTLLSWKESSKQLLDNISSIL